MNQETVEYLDREKACKKYVRRTGKAAFLVGRERAKENSELLRIVELDNFFPAEGLIIFYAAFPEKKENEQNT